MTTLWNVLLGKNEAIPEVQSVPFVPGIPGLKGQAPENMKNLVEGPTIDFIKTGKKLRETLMDEIKAMPGFPVRGVSEKSGLDGLRPIFDKITKFDDGEKLSTIDGLSSAIKDMWGEDVNARKFSGELEKMMKFLGADAWKELPPVEIVKSKKFVFIDPIDPRAKAENIMDQWFDNHSGGETGGTGAVPDQRTVEASTEGMEFRNIYEYAKLMRAMLYVFRRIKNYGENKERQLAAKTISVEKVVEEEKKKEEREKAFVADLMTSFWLRYVYSIQLYAEAEWEYIPLEALDVPCRIREGSTPNTVVIDCPDEIVDAPDLIGDERYVEEVSNEASMRRKLVIDMLLTHLAESGSRTPETTFETIGTSTAKIVGALSDGKIHSSFPRILGIYIVPHPVKPPESIKTKHLSKLTDAEEIGWKPVLWILRENKGVSLEDLISISGKHASREYAYNKFQRTVGSLAEPETKNTLLGGAWSALAGAVGDAHAQSTDDPERLRTVINNRLANMDNVRKAMNLVDLIEIMDQARIPWGVDVLAGTKLIPTKNSDGTVNVEKYDTVQADECALSANGNWNLFIMQVIQHTIGILNDVQFHCNGMFNNLNTSSIFIKPHSIHFGEIGTTPESLTKAYLDTYSTATNGDPISMPKVTLHDFGQIEAVSTGYRGFSRMITISIQDTSQFSGIFDLTNFPRAKHDSEKDKSTDWTTTKKLQMSRVVHDATDFLRSYPNQWNQVMMRYIADQRSPYFDAAKDLSMLMNYFVYDIRWPVYRHPVSLDYFDVERIRHMETYGSLRMMEQKEFNDSVLVGSPIASWIGSSAPSILSRFVGINVDDQPAWMRGMRKINTTLARTVPNRVVLTSAGDFLADLFGETVMSDRTAVLRLGKFKPRVRWPHSDQFVKTLGKLDLHRMILTRYGWLTRLMSNVKRRWDDDRTDTYLKAVSLAATKVAEKKDPLELPSDFMESWKLPTISTLGAGEVSQVSISSPLPINSKKRKEFFRQASTFANAKRPIAKEHHDTLKNLYTGTVRLKSRLGGGSQGQVYALNVMKPADPPAETLVVDQQLAIKAFPPMFGDEGLLCSRMTPTEMQCPAFINELNIAIAMSQAYANYSTPHFLEVNHVIMGTMEVKDAIQSELETTIKVAVPEIEEVKIETGIRVPGSDTPLDRIIDRALDHVTADVLEADDNAASTDGGYMDDLFGNVGTVINAARENTRRLSRSNFGVDDSSYTNLPPEGTTGATGGEPIELGDGKPTSPEPSATGDPTTLPFDKSLREILDGIKKSTRYDQMGDSFRKMGANGIEQASQYFRKATVNRTESVLRAYDVMESMISARTIGSSGYLREDLAILLQISETLNGAISANKTILDTWKSLFNATIELRFGKQVEDAISDVAESMAEVRKYRRGLGRFISSKNPLYQRALELATLSFFFKTGRSPSDVIYPFITMEKINGDMSRFDRIIKVLEEVRAQKGMAPIAHEVYIHNAMFQMVMALHQFQYLFAGMHNDAHIENFFVKLCDDTLFEGQKLSETRFFKYDVPVFKTNEAGTAVKIEHMKFSLPNMGFLVKLGDPGHASIQIPMTPYVLGETRPPFTLDSKTRLTLHKEFAPGSGETFWMVMLVSAKTIIDSDVIEGYINKLLTYVFDKLVSIFLSDVSGTLANLLDTIETLEELEGESVVKAHLAKVKGWLSAAVWGAEFANSMVSVLKIATDLVGNFDEGVSMFKGIAGANAGPLAAGLAFLSTSAAPTLLPGFQLTKGLYQLLTPETAITITQDATEARQEGIGEMIWGYIKGMIKSAAKKWTKKRIKMYSKLIKKHLTEALTQMVIAAAGLDIIAGVTQTMLRRRFRHFDKSFDLAVLMNFMGTMPLYYKSTVVEIYECMETRSLQDIIGRAGMRKLYRPNSMSGRFVRDANTEAFVPPSYSATTTTPQDLLIGKGVRGKDNWVESPFEAYRDE